jgi:hypothetical protein
MKLYRAISYLRLYPAWRPGIWGGTMRCTTIGLALLAFAGCSIQRTQVASQQPTVPATVTTPPAAPTPARGRFPNLEAVYQAAGAANADMFPVDVRDKLVNCAAHAIVVDIPQSDEERMLAAINRGKIGPEDDLLFQKWLVTTYIHGRILEPKIDDPSSYAHSKLHYEDGTPVAPTDPAFKTRIKANMARYCPALADQYARYLE